MKMKRGNKQGCCPDSSRRIAASKEHVVALKALAHIGRLRVFFHLVQAKRPLQANELQAAMKLPGPTLSHHLNELEQAGLIERTRRERFVFSAVRRDMVVELVRILTACC